MSFHQLSLDKKEILARMHDEGLPQVQMARILNVSPSTISYQLDKLRNDPNYLVLPPNRGHPAGVIHEVRTVRKIVMYALSHPFESISSIARSGIVPFEISRHTVARILQDNGIFNRVAREKPQLTAANKAKRLQFALKYLHWTADDWRAVMFSDESAFEIGKRYSRMRVNRRRGEEYFEKNMIHTRASGQKTIMIWGGVSGYFQTPVHIIPAGQSFRSAQYLQVLKDNLPTPFSQNLANYFQQDNATIHTAGVVKSWIIYYDWEWYMQYYYRR